MLQMHNFILESIFQPIGLESAFTARNVLKHPHTPPIVQQQQQQQQPVKEEND